MKRISIRAVAAAAAAAVAIVALVAVLSSGGVAHSSHAPESIFQDDNHLLYADPATIGRTLGLLQAIGVDRIRITVEWAYIAPDATSATEPAGFHAADPADYPAGAWDRYDRIVEMAEARGIGVDFNVTDPGPLWAMHRAPAAMRRGATPADYQPSASAFGRFVQALGRRYSGAYVPPTGSGGHALPRVSFWSIWNEPNQPSWLAPQWRSAGRQRVPAAPARYRALVDAAVAGLKATGHTVTTDTILVGETAPEGSVNPVAGSHPQRYVSATGADDAMTPMVFLRALYCVNARYRRLTGTAATALGCPASGNANDFVKANPGLFDATGFAHHPYFFLFAPNVSSPIADYVPLADLGRLERGLDLAFAAYGESRRIPIYLTEYGYQTNPPDPGQHVTPAEQAAYLNEADYMAWRDPRVRSVTQFLLYDSGPAAQYPPSSTEYWGSTFQTGLIYGPGTPRDGRAKPALRAYALPVWIPDPDTRRGSKLLIWGMLRLAPKRSAQVARIQWRPAGQSDYRAIATVDVPASATYGYFTTRVTAPGRGSIRIAWRSPKGGTATSRAVAVGVRGVQPGGNFTVPSGSASVSQAYDHSQTIAPCEFSSPELQRAEDSVPNDEMQYDQGYVAAIEQARQQQASGACASGRTAAVTGTGTSSAATPAPPALPPLGQSTALDVGSATAATHSGLPAPIVILMVIGGLLALTAIALGAAHLQGWDPAWAARARHSWSEAGYRASGIWSELDDRLRRR
ncbi:MAG TPA: hypothetical protein VIJ20_13915 [Solirubrobacteraceae bacterium]